MLLRSATPRHGLGISPVDTTPARPASLQSADSARPATGTRLITPATGCARPANSFTGGGTGARMLLAVCLPALLLMLRGCILFAYPAPPAVSFSSYLPCMDGEWGGLLDVRVGSVHEAAFLGAQWPLAATGASTGRKTSGHCSCGSKLASASASGSTSPRAPASPTTRAGCTSVRSVRSVGLRRPGLPHGRGSGLLSEGDWGALLAPPCWGPPPTGLATSD